MESIGIEDFGEVVTFTGARYDQGTEGLKDAGAEVKDITARNMAYIRANVEDTHELILEGSWIVDELVYNVPGITNPVLFLGGGSVFYNPKKATEEHDAVKEFKLNNDQLNMPEALKTYGNQWDVALGALTKEQVGQLERGEISPLELVAYELPEKKSFFIQTSILENIDPTKLSDPEYFKTLPAVAKVAAVLFKDQLGNYVEEVLKPSGIARVSFSLFEGDHVDKQEGVAFARALMLRGSDGKFEISATEGLHGYFDMRGLQNIVGEAGSAYREAMQVPILGAAPANEQATTPEDEPATTPVDEPEPAATPEEPTQEEYLELSLASAVELGALGVYMEDNVTSFKLTERGNQSDGVKALLEKGVTSGLLEAYERGGEEWYRNIVHDEESTLEQTEVLEEVVVEDPDTIEFQQKMRLLRTMDKFTGYQKQDLQVLSESLERGYVETEGEGADTYYKATQDIHSGLLNLIDGLKGIPREDVDSLTEALNEGQIDVSSYEQGRVWTLIDTPSNEDADAAPE